jgi:hypothetical protein
MEKAMCSNTEMNMFNNIHQPPLKMDCINNIKGAKYFRLLELTQGYLQVKLHDDDKHKTAFHGLGFLYEFN